MSVGPLAGKSVFLLPAMSEHITRRCNADVCDGRHRAALADYVFRRWEPQTE